MIPCSLHAPSAEDVKNMQAYYKPQTCTVNWELQAILPMCELSRSEHTVMRARRSGRPSVLRAPEREIVRVCAREALPTAL